MGYSLWGRKELGTTEQLTHYLAQHGPQSLQNQKASSPSRRARAPAAAAAKSLQSYLSPQLHFTDEKAELQRVVHLGSTRALVFCPSPTPLGIICIYLHLQRLVGDILRKVGASFVKWRQVPKQSMNIPGFFCIEN